MSKLTYLPLPNVRPKNFGLGVELSNDHIVELDKYIKDLRFLFQKIDPTYTSTVIHKEEKNKRSHVYQIQGRDPKHQNELNKRAISMSQARTIKMFVTFG